MSNRPYSDFLNASYQVMLDSQKVGFPYYTAVNDVKVVVHQGVFSPAFYEDTAFFAQFLPFPRQGRFLEVGCGTGAIMLSALYAGVSEAVGLDINPAALLNGRANMCLHGFGHKSKIQHSNVFSALKATEQFDLIFWNLPFGFVENPVYEWPLFAIYDQRYRAIEHFFSHARRHLKPSGQLFVGFSSTLGRWDLLNEMANKYGWNLKVLHQDNFTEIYPVHFELIKCLPYDQF